MAGREVETVEVVVRRLHLAAVHDAVAQPEKDVFDLPADLRDQVQVAALVAADGQRDVGAFLREAAVELGPLELALARADRRLDPLARGVQGHPRLAVANLAERELQLALPPEVLDPYRLDRVRRRRGGDRREGRLLERLDIHGRIEATK